MGYAIISYDLHKADKSDYARLDLELLKLLFQKLGVATVWKKPYGASGKPSTLDMARTDFDRAATAARCPDYTLDVFASDTEIDTKQFTIGDTAIAKALIRDGKV